MYIMQAKFAIKFNLKMIGRRIRVVSRLRPPTIPGESCTVTTTEGRIIHAGKHSFEFDAVYGTKSR